MLDLETLRSYVMDKWVVFYTKEFHLEHDEEGVLDESKLIDLTVRYRKRLEQIALVVVSECLGFSDNKNESAFLELESIVTVENVAYNQDNFSVEVWADQIAHAVKDIMNKIKLYGPINKTSEASVREHVSPVLSLAALITEDIMMKAEQKVSGLRGNGPLDYLFLYRKFPIPVTEVKNEDIEAGVAQNDAQLVAARQEYKRNLQVHLPELKEKSKKRKYLELDISSIPSFGIVSSGRDWLFQRLQEEQGAHTTTIYKSKVMSINLMTGTEAAIKKEMLEVVRHIVFILKCQKEAVDAHKDAKRVRNYF